MLKNRYLMIICSMNSRKNVTEGGTEQDNNNTSIHKFSKESAGIKKNACDFQLYVNVYKYMCAKINTYITL